MKIGFFGRTSVKQLLLKVKSVLDTKADKSSITEFITSKEKDSADVVEGYFEDETNYATVGYVNNEINSCITTQYAFDIKD